jgi:hypothetical protein
MKKLLHRLFSTRHRGIYSLYMCCHECGKLQERICIPFYPCPCIYAKAELDELRMLGGKWRISEQPHGWMVEWGTELQNSGVQAPTILEAARSALSCARSLTAACDEVGIDRKEIRLA